MCVQVCVCVCVASIVFKVLLVRCESLQGYNLASWCGLRVVLKMRGHDCHDDEIGDAEGA